MADWLPGLLRAVVLRGHYLGRCLARADVNCVIPSGNSLVLCGLLLGQDVEVAGMVPAAVPITGIESTTRRQMLARSRGDVW